MNMSKNDLGILLSKALSLPGGGGINKVYLDIMLEEDLPILCVNWTEHTHKLIPFKPFYEHARSFGLGNSAETYYLTGYGLDRLKELAIAKTGSWNFTEEEEEVISKEKPKTSTLIETDMSQEEKNFGSDYDNFAQMTVKQKIERLNYDKIRLNDLVLEKNHDNLIVADVLASSARDAAMVNHTILKEIKTMPDEQAKAYSKEVVMYTNEIVKTSAHLLTENILSDELMRTITEKSKGIVFQHITRVYLNGVAFLEYLNKIISSSSAILKIKTSFTLKYRKFYQMLLPHMDGYDVTLDNVFKEGLKKIPSDILYKWSVGFLLHDLGKAADIEYHESDAAYDRVKVVDHVKVGYSSITEKTNYPKEAGLIVGYHHEYYGDSDGYGPYRDDLAEYKSQVADVKQEYCMTYETESILDFKALSFFPAKVLEIVDIYDSLTDPRRVYRKAMPSEEALDMMYREFIIKRHKIDPILFDIFINFIHDKEAVAALL